MSLLGKLAKVILKIRGNLILLELKNHHAKYTYPMIVFGR